MVDKLSGSDLRVAAALLWAAWHCQNLHIFEDQTPCDVLLASNFANYVSEYCSYVKVRGGQDVATSTLVNSWVHPTQGFVKINVDAHVPAVGKVGLGVAGRKRNHNGESLFAAMKAIHRTGSDIYNRGSILQYMD